MANPPWRLVITAINHYLKSGLRGVKCNAALSYNTMCHSYEIKLFYIFRMENLERRPANDLALCQTGWNCS